MSPELAASGQVLRRGHDVVVAIEPRVIGLEVAADVYGVSADTIARLQDAGEIPTLRIGTRRLVHVATTDAWFAAQVTTQAGAA